ncbi:unnamed protein product, partial [Angiostrongylus costaricensis]|uniref:Methyltranfer_dom domain-containing protein n=1 Tax=Angiostrongylus costaricensis TaxID=334426 RepID=A0A0R3PVK3_ANGCS
FHQADLATAQNHIVLTSKSPKKREFAVPEQAISGLRNALTTCERSPKQIQHEADQLSEVLLHRRFPAPPSVVREARNKVKNMLKKREEQDMWNLLIRNEVDKILKKTHFTWQPLSVETKENAAAYALSQLAPNYAEISRVLDEFKGSNFCPDSVLDYGCGIGNPLFEVSGLSMNAMDDKGNLLPRNINFRRHLPTSVQKKYDLVIAHRTLCEVDSRESRLELVTSLWRRTNRFLVLIDSGLHDAFEALMEARDFLLLSGVQLHLEDTVSLLKVDIYTVLNDRNISDLERFLIIHDQVPAEIVLPTALPPAKIYAPCPHDLGCPKLMSRSSCTFPVRWRVIRADGKHSSREISGTETRKFSFLLLLSVIHFVIYFHIRHLDGHVTCDLCTSFNGIQRMTISRRAGMLYRWARARRDGEIFPLQTKDETGSLHIDHLIK